MSFSKRGFSMSQATNALALSAKASDLKVDSTFGVNPMLSPVHERIVDAEPEVRTGGNRVHLSLTRTPGSARCAKAPSQRPLRRLAAPFFAVMTFVAAAMPLPASARSAPESFADLAQEVTGQKSHPASAAARNPVRGSLRGVLQPPRPGQWRQRAFAPAQFEFAGFRLRDRFVGHRGHQQSRDR